jgi:hypothetical protein
MGKSFSVQISVKIYKASTTLCDRQKVNDLETYVCKHDETPVIVYKDDEEILAQVLTGTEENAHRKTTAKAKKYICLRPLKLAK